MVNILLADDQPEVRSALKLLLQQKAQAHIVGEAENIRTLLEQPKEPGPDVILVDWELPGLSPADSVSTVRQSYPSARIVALSSQPEAHQPALQAGADAFVCKGDPPETLLAVLERWGL
jgi:DNA-binding NarL/FixJ family response regulator